MYNWFLGYFQVRIFLYNHNFILYMDWLNRWNFHCVDHIHNFRNCLRLCLGFESWFRSFKQKSQTLDVKEQNYVCSFSLLSNYYWKFSFKTCLDSDFVSQHRSERIWKSINIQTAHWRIWNYEKRILEFSQNGKSTHYALWLDESSPKELL